MVNEANTTYVWNIENTQYSKYGIKNIEKIQKTEHMHSINKNVKCNEVDVMNE